MIRFLAAILFAAVAHCAAADKLTGRVVSIADGDTITVLDTANTQYKIRLSGVDAPDLQVPSNKS